MVAQQNLRAGLADAGRPDAALVPLAETLAAHQASGLRPTEAFVLSTPGGRTLGQRTRQRPAIDGACAGPGCFVSFPATRRRGASVRYRCGGARP